MHAQVRIAMLSLALTVAGGVASAQTVIERVEQPAVVTTAPLSLTPAQRTTVYRTIVPRGKNRQPIVKERVVTETIGQAPAVNYVVGDRVPAGVELVTVPQEVAVEVPAIRQYRYMMVNNRLLLVDPATSTVVAEIQD